MHRPSELHQLGIKAKKSLSQNFLIDANIIEKLLVAADIQPEDAVLEVGPGPGAITEKILQKDAKVLAIEKDRRFAEKLEQPPHPHLTVLCQDALTFSLDNLSMKHKVVANLPFKITTPLLTRWIHRMDALESLTLIVQKEVGLRMCAKTNTKDYSSFSLFIQSYCEPRLCFTIKPSSFFPRPKVHCCVVHLKLRPFPFAVDPKGFFLLIRTAFGKRRKMLKVSLRQMYAQKQIATGLQILGASPLARPQELSLEQFSTLFAFLDKNKCSDEKDCC